MVKFKEMLNDLNTYNAIWEEILKMNMIIQKKMLHSPLLRTEPPLFRFRNQINITNNND